MPFILHPKIFNEKSRLERHQMVYQALEDLMKSKIHALQIKATTTAIKAKSKQRIIQLI